MRQRQILKEFLGIALVLLSVYLLVALFTFHTGDVPFLRAPGNESVYNACGALGAAVAFRLLFAVGTLASWALSLLVGAWGVSMVLRRSWPDLPYKVTGILLFLLALSVGEALATDGALSTLPHGGVLGIFMTKVVLLANLGHTGTYLAVFYVALISFLLATDFLFLETALEAVGKVRLGGRFLVRRAGGRPVRRGDSELWLSEEMEDARRRREQKLRREHLLALIDDESAEQAALAAWPRATSVATLGPARDLAEPEVELDDFPETRIEAPPARRVEIPEEEAEEAPDASDEEAESAREETRVEAPPAPPAEEPEPPELVVREEPEEEPQPEEAPKPRRRKPAADRKAGSYTLPPDELLEEAGPPSPDEDRINQLRCRVLEETLSHFKISGRVKGVLRGPSITQFELELAQGTKSRQVLTLQNDLALALKVEKVRIVSPLPGRGTIGVEVPNSFRETVVLKELLAAHRGDAKERGIPLFLGKDAAGSPVLGDLTEMPHMLIAGSTGSGKSICLNAVLTGILATRSPDEVKLVLVDPKRVEMTPYRDVPHLLVPVLTEPKRAAAVLEGLTALMDKRYETFEKLRVRQISSYNRMKREDAVSKLEAAGADPAKIEHPMPYIIVVVDELSDLMLQTSREVENAIIRLAQKSRAVGIHLILSTQRPSSDVITGMIKANMPARIAFKVTSMVESRVILDQNGAEKLLGRGDMLYLPPKVSHLLRAQGTFVSDEEVGRVVDFWVDQARPRFDDDAPELEASGLELPEGDDDKLLEAGDIVMASGRASTTLLQRRLAIGYTRAARLVDLLEKAGLVGPFNQSRPREILLTFEEWEAYKEKQARA